MHTLRFRPETSADDNFLIPLYASCRADAALLSQWPSEQRDLFINQQFQLQRQHYQREYPNADYSIILADEQAVGRWYLYRDEAYYELLDIGLIPDYRNKTIGSQLLHELLNEAQRVKKPVRVFVEQDNRAQRFYARLGFNATEVHGAHVLLTWQPNCTNP